jgi:hypothetical protein
VSGGLSAHSNPAVTVAPSARSNLTVTVAGASDEEAAAAVAAVEQFVRERAQAAAPVAAEPPVSAWKRAALREGISRQADQ